MYCWGSFEVMRISIIQVEQKRVYVKKEKPNLYILLHAVIKRKYINTLDFDRFFLSIYM